MLLLSLLRETSLISGGAWLPTPMARELTDPSQGLAETVAYCAQSPWLISASIRDNIVFGAPFDEARYLDTLYACALVADLAVLASSDQTQVGPRGTQLSGGQKARIVRAMAV